MSIIRKVIPFGTQELILETGEIARQATGAVMVSMGGTRVLVTVVGSKDVNASRDFFH